MNKETIDNILMTLNYRDDDNGERHYEILGLRRELESHIIGIIAKHDREGIKINKKYLDMLENDEDNICEHNNTITNNCSDCDDNELYDLLLRPVLQSIRDSYVGGPYNNLTDLIYSIHEGEVDLTDEIVEKIEQDILKRLTL